MGFTRKLVEELGLETVLREREVPEPVGMLDEADGDVHGARGRFARVRAGFCAVKRGQPEAVMDDEPARVGGSVARGWGSSMW